MLALNSNFLKNKSTLVAMFWIEAKLKKKANKRRVVVPAMEAYSKPLFQPSFLIIKGTKRRGNNFVAMPNPRQMADPFHFFPNKRKKESSTKKIITLSKWTLPESSIITNGFSI